MAEKWEEDRQHKMEVEFARAEGAHEALPESRLESHELIRALHRQVAELIAQIKAPGPKWRERVWGFGFGVAAASLVATAVWPRLIVALQLLENHGDRPRFSRSTTMYEW
ncbi:MAG: hypothetical protein KKE21_00665 [Gammaproteobacteria bacterium]|nr:hypothetical protein [Gammaproteobacteria bacterium]